MKIERKIFQAVIISDKQENEITKIANHVRFSKKIHMVDDVWNKVELKRLSGNVSVFTVVNEYEVHCLGFRQYLQHLFCKVRAAALHYMGRSACVSVVIDDTGLSPMHFTL